MRAFLFKLIFTFSNLLVFSGLYANEPIFYVNEIINKLNKNINVVFTTEQGTYIQKLDANTRQKLEKPIPIKLKADDERVSHAEMKIKNASSLNQDHLTLKISKVGSGYRSISLLEVRQGLMRFLEEWKDKVRLNPNEQAECAITVLLDGDNLEKLTFDGVGLVK